MKASNSRDRMIQLPPGNGATLADTGEPLTTDVANFFVSPRCANGQPTKGLAISLLSIGGDGVGGQATAAAGGFSLTLYRAIATMGVGTFAKLKTLTGIAYGDQLVLGDISGGWELFLRVSNIDVGGARFVNIALSELP